MRKLLTIRWIGFHVLTFGCVVLFSFLGHWQWDVGDSRRGTLRNYAYGVEWWVFGVILLVLWWRLLRQELHGDAHVNAAKRAAISRAPRYRAPAPQIAAHVDDADDPEMAAYNRYLESLHNKDVAAGGAGGRRGR